MRWLVCLLAVFLCLGVQAQEVVPAPAPLVNSSDVAAPVIAMPASSPVVVPLDKPIPPLIFGNLWDRIRGGFGIPNLQDSYVTNQEQWYSSRPDYIVRMTERSKKYLYYVVEELENRHMPTELALLPFIESAFNPQAMSSAKAAGMWQFIPSTGKTFALKQNAFRDDRRDVLASTRAALDYLQKLYGMFGDWQLALAAYNWGEGSVARAIDKNIKLGLPTDYASLQMPNETRNYVPKLQAVKNIVADPSFFNAPLPDIENRPYFQSIPITHDIDVNLAAKLAEVPLADFKALNPSFSRPVILAAGTPQVLMPSEKAESFLDNLKKYTGQLASWTAWIVPKALRPKDAAKQVGMTEANLREVNGIPLKSGVITAGSTLLVPRSASTTKDVTGSVADAGQLTMVTPQSKIKSAKKGSKNRAGTKNAHAKTSNRHVAHAQSTVKKKHS